MLRIGKSRFVLIIGPLVFKIPRVSFIHFFAVNFGDMIKGRNPWFWSWLWFKMIALGGIMENLREASCYFHTRHKLLARLYLPLIIVNVYRRENGVGNFTFGGDELIFKVVKIGDQGYIRAIQPCCHTFDHADNFAFSDGQIKILDYGEEGVENLLTGYGIEVEKLLLSVVK